MGRTRIVTIRFDLSDKYDAATYHGLAESGRRAYRGDRGMQANYLVSLVLGVRPYMGLQEAGLAAPPQVLPDIDERLSHLRARCEELERQIASRPVHRPRPAPVLRLLPNSDRNSPYKSA